MLSDNQLKKKFEILANKLKANLFEDVIIESQALLKKRKHQVFFNMLSLAYQNTGQFNKSIEIMEEALRTNAKNPFFLNNMGSSHYLSGNLIKAQEYFKRGLEFAPKNINILNNLANLKKDLNHTKEAIDYYKKALTIKNDILEIQLNLAYCYQSIGEFENSKKYLESILEINPKFTVADRILSSMTKYSQNKNHLDKMIKKVENLSLNELELSNLYFALGKAFEDIKDYKKSFENYKQGNSILKKLIKFDINDEINIFNQIKKKYSLIKDFNILKNNKKIIFIVGMPRSGTSLIEQILSSHDEVYGGGELIFLPKIIDNNFLNKENLKFKDSETQIILEKCQKEYIDNINLMDISHHVFTDKLPLNFKYIGFIKCIFPNSKIIHCKRDAIETSWSNYKNYFSNSLPFTNSFEDIVNFYKFYLEIMEFWKNEISSEIHEIKYETLIEEPEKNIKEILNFCELDWSEKCLNHHKNSKSIKTASATQARKPIYKTALKSTSNYLEFINPLIQKLKN